MTQGKSPFANPLYARGYRKGLDARDNQDPLSHNPHEAATPEFDGWVDGWHKADELWSESDRRELAERTAGADAAEQVKPWQRAHLMACAAAKSVLRFRAAMVDGEAANDLAAYRAARWCRRQAEKTVIRYAEEAMQSAGRPAHQHEAADSNGA